MIGKSNIQLTQSDFSVIGGSISSWPRPTKNHENTIWVTTDTNITDIYIDQAPNFPNNILDGTLWIIPDDTKDYGYFTNISEKDKQLNLNLCECLQYFYQDNIYNYNKGWVEKRGYICKNKCWNQFTEENFLIHPLRNGIVITSETFAGFSSNKNNGRVTELSIGHNDTSFILYQDGDGIHFRPQSNLLGTSIVEGYLSRPIYINNINNGYIKIEYSLSGSSSTLNHSNLTFGMVSAANLPIITPRNDFVDGLVAFDRYYFYSAVSHKEQYINFYDFEVTPGWYYLELRAQRTDTTYNSLDLVIHDIKVY